MMKKELKKDLMKMFGLKCAPCWNFVIIERADEYIVYYRYSLLGKVMAFPISLLSAFVAFAEEFVSSLDSYSSYSKRDTCSPNYNYTLYEKIKGQL